MHKMIPFVFLLLFTAIAAHGNEIAMRVFWNGEIYGDLLMKPLASTQKIGLYVQIKNTGSKMTKVFLQKKDPSSGSKTVERDPSKRQGLISYRIGFQVPVGSGERVIPSECDLRPVLLNPGEQAEVQLEVWVSGGMTLARFELEYIVAEDLAQRFGGWAGKVVAPVLDQSSTNIREAKFYPDSSASSEPNKTTSGDRLNK